MAVPKQRDSKSKVGRRRSQKKLGKLRIVPCVECSAPKMIHRTCPACGYIGKRKKSGTKPFKTASKKESSKTVEGEVKTAEGIKKKKKKTDPSESPEKTVKDSGGEQS